MAEASPQVFLVGAGPGNPGLLTLRALECLAQADLVIYDRLVPQSFLDHAPAAAERLCVADLPGGHAHRYPQAHAAMIAAARQGKRVVRLKGGDPFLFGRGGEEAEALANAGLSYEVVPGVTAGLAAPAYAGIPLTHRLHASAVAFVTGHEDLDKPDSAIDWGALARFPGTLVAYMGMSRLTQIVQALLDQGKPGDTPAAAIQWGTTGEQRTVACPLHALAASVQTAHLKAPAIIVIGSVVSLRPTLAWFEQRPLFGKHVLVTRPRPQAVELAGRLQELGAVTYLLPTVEIREPADWGPVDSALRCLAEYDWLVFTSTNGVHAFMRRLRHLGLDLRLLGRTKLAVIGPASADALRGYYLEPDLVPAEFRSECLAAALQERVAGQRLLLARADRGRDLLRDQLATIATVTQIAVYSQVDVFAADTALRERLQKGRMDYVTLTSSNVARSFLTALAPAAQARVRAGEIQLVSISPITSAAVRELGFPVAAEATEHTSAGVLEVLLRLTQDSK
jgi:uroporphyrinogen III methyltransferase/synthase